MIILFNILAGCGFIYIIYDFYTGDADDVKINWLFYLILAPMFIKFINGLL